MLPDSAPRARSLRGICHPAGMNYEIQIQVADDIHALGAFCSVHQAADVAHTEASHFGGLKRSRSALREAIEAGDKVVELRPAGPYIAVLIA